jgi:hypothetical protein
MQDDEDQFPIGDARDPEHQRKCKAMIVDLLLRCGPLQQHEIEDRLGTTMGLEDVMVKEGMLVEVVPALPHYTPGEDIGYGSAYAIKFDIDDVFDRYHRS